MLLRGAVRRCAWCGGRGAFFTGWFSKQEHCRSCGLQWRRGDIGFELGAATMTAFLTMGPLVVLLGIMTAIMWPDVKAVPMFVVLVPLAIVLPFLTYAQSYTMWQAVDILMRAPEPDDFEIVADPSTASSSDSAAR